MSRAFLAVLLILALAAPSAAKDVTLAGTWVDYIIRHDASGGAEPDDDKKVTGVIIGDYAFAMEETPLTTIRQYLGGKLHMSGEAGEAMTWLCYTTDLQAFYIYSDGEMGDGKPSAVVLDNRGPAPASAGCARYRGDSIDLDLGVVAIGRPTREAMAAYGRAKPDDTGTFAYGSISPLQRDPAMMEWQDIYYHSTDGVIDAIGVTQITGD